VSGPRAQCRSPCCTLDPSPHHRRFAEVYPGSACLRGRSYAAVIESRVFQAGCSSCVGHVCHELLQECCWFEGCLSLANCIQGNHRFLGKTTRVKERQGFAGALWCECGLASVAAPAQSVNRLQVLSFRRLESAGDTGVACAALDVVRESGVLEVVVGSLESGDHGILSGRSSGVEGALHRIVAV